MTRTATFVGAWAAVLAIAGGCRSTALDKTPAPEQAADVGWTRDGDPIDGPAGARWSRAWISISYSPPERGYHARHSGDLDVTLELTVDGAHQTARIDEASTSEYSHDEFQALAGARPKLVSALDGHALAFSMDGGARWWLIIADAGDRPFPCLHAPVDPAALPATRDFVLDVLRAPEPHWSLRGSRTPRAQSWSDVEVRGALGFAKAHPDDVEVRRAWAAYIVRPGDDFPYGDSEVFPIIDWMQTVACNDDQARATLVAAVDNGDPAMLRQRGRAARSLARCTQPEVQNAIARFMRSEIDGSAAAADHHFAFGAAAWSLGAVTHQRRAATPEAMAILIELARGPDLTGDDHAGRAARIAAIRALAVLPTEEAHAVLEKLAALPLEYPQRANLPPLPWPREFVQWNENMGGESDVGVWARAALAANPRPK